MTFVRFLLTDLCAVETRRVAVYSVAIGVARGQRNWKFTLRLRSFVVSGEADVSSGSFGFAEVSFCIVLVMNEHMVNGLPNEQQEMKSTDSKTGNTGKFSSTAFFLSRHFI